MQRGAPLKSVAFFNNKGGVGKTTLVCNLAAYFASERGLKVLVVDCDPQCNTTQLILSPDECDELYWGNDSQGPNAPATISTIVGPLEVGEIELDTRRPVLSGSSNRFGVDLIPGDPAMSIFEDLLGKWWSDGAGGDLGAIRKTNWVTMLLDKHRDYDLVIFDLGPSLGSLNRSVLMAIDYFMSPLGADTFSVLALKNIQTWFAQWGKNYKQSLLNAKSTYGDRVDHYSIQRTLKIESGFLGYTVQQYVTRTTKGERRPTRAYERILDRIPEQVDASLADYAPDGLDLDDLRLGDVPNLYSLVPLAQDVNAPIAGLQRTDGLAGGQFSQQQDYIRMMHSLGASLAKNLGI